MDWGSCVDKTADQATGVATIKCIPIIFMNLINAALIFSGTVAAIFIIIAGYKYIRSGGDPKQVDGARKTMTYAIIGLVLILSAFLIINIISAVTGLSCIRLIGFTNCVGN